VLIYAATMVPPEVVRNTVEVGSWLRHDPPEDHPPTVFIDNSERNLGLVESYQVAYQDAKANPRNDVICYLHTDVTIHGPWINRFAREFGNPTVGVVGMGGATRLGHPDLYKVPYRLEQLARYGYRSNATDAEAHGERFRGECNVAVLDGFCLAVRTDLLDRCGGWPVGEIETHCYDTWLACMARRHGYRTRLVGVSCHHAGGGKATPDGRYEEWLRERGTTDAEDHARAHRWLATECMEELPFEVEP